MTFTAAKRIASDTGGRCFYCSGCGYIAFGPTASRWHECPKPPGLLCGPGCQLRRSLSWFVRDDGRCGCTEFAAKMDAWGPAVCEAKLDEIVAHLLEQAAKKSVFLGAVPAVAVVPLVRKAIDAARAEIQSPPS